MPSRRLASRALGVAVCMLVLRAEAAVSCGWSPRVHAGMGVSLPMGPTTENLDPMVAGELGGGGACEHLGLGGDVTLAAQAMVRPAPAQRYWYAGVWLRPELRVTESLYLRVALGGVRREIALTGEVIETRHFAAGGIGWDLRLPVRRGFVSVSWSYEMALSIDKLGFQQVRLGVAWVHRLW